MDELTHALCRQAGALRDRGSDSRADDLEQAATVLVQLQAENAALRARLEIFEFMQAALDGNVSLVAPQGDAQP